MFAPRLFLLNNNTPLVVRQALSQDAAALMALMANTFGNTEQPLPQQTAFQVEASVQAYARQLQQYWTMPGYLWLLAILEGQLVGSLNFANGQGITAHQGEFSISVAPAYQGCHIGTHLLSALLDWASSHPLIKKVQLEVLASNKPALRLYRQLGFEAETSITPALLGPTMIDDNVLRLYRLV